MLKQVLIQFISIVLLAFLLTLPSSASGFFLSESKAALPTHTKHIPVLMRKAGSRTFSDLEQQQQQAASDVGPHVAVPGYKNPQEGRGESTQVIGGHKNKHDDNGLSSELHEITQQLEDEEEDNYNEQDEGPEYDHYSEEIDERCPDSKEIFYEKSQLCVPRKCEAYERRDLESGGCLLKKYRRYWAYAPGFYRYGSRNLLQFSGMKNRLHNARMRLRG